MGALWPSNIPCRWALMATKFYPHTASLCPHNSTNILKNKRQQKCGRKYLQELRESDTSDAFCHVSPTTAKKFSFGFIRNNTFRKHHIASHGKSEQHKCYS